MAVSCASSMAVVNTGQVLIEPLPVVEVALTLNAIQLEQLKNRDTRTTDVSIRGG